MLVTVGYLVVLLSVFGGYMLSGGHLYAIFQPLELMIIGGAALGSFFVGNSIKVIKETIYSVLSTLKGSRYSKTFYVQLLSLLFEIANKIKKDGVLSIESDLDNQAESPIFNAYPLVKKEGYIMEFLSDYLRLVITGRVNVHQMEKLIDQDIETYECEQEQPIHAINKIADGLPAFGIVAAVLGIVHTMESMGSVPPEQLGGLIAKALVGTFLGVLLSYGFIAPLSSILEQKLHASLKVLNAIKVVVLATVSNVSPSMAVEFGRKIIYSKERPNGLELDSLLKGIKQQNMGVKSE